MTFTARVGQVVFWLAVAFIMAPSKGSMLSVGIAIGLLLIVGGIGIVGFRLLLRVLRGYRK